MRQCRLKRWLEQESLRCRRWRLPPAVLESYLGFSGALAGGLQNAKIREQLALLTAQENANAVFYCPEN
jgi:hypothetical protein